MAISAADAKHKVADAIQFDKIERDGGGGAPELTPDDAINYLKGMFGMK